MQLRTYLERRSIDSESFHGKEQKFKRMTIISGWSSYFFLLLSVSNDDEFVDCGSEDASVDICAFLLLIEKVSEFERWRNW